MPNQDWIDNFHTGYNLNALADNSTLLRISEFEPYLRRGFEFYRKHFFREDGAVRYFHDRTYPIDIHCVAQSLLTLLEFEDLYPSNIGLVRSVYNWAMKHMWNEAGFFYYRVLRTVTIRTSYMRWSQAWMLLALTTLAERRGRYTAALRLRHLQRRSGRPAERRLKGLPVASSRWHVAVLTFSLSFFFFLRFARYTSPLFRTRFGCDIGSSQRICDRESCPMAAFETGVIPPGTSQAGSSGLLWSAGDVNLLANPFPLVGSTPFGNQFILMNPGLAGTDAQLVGGFVTCKTYDLFTFCFASIWGGLPSIHFISLTPKWQPRATSSSLDQPEWVFSTWQHSI